MMFHVSCGLERPTICWCPLSLRPAVPKRHDLPVTQRTGCWRVETILNKSLRGHTDESWQHLSAELALPVPLSSTTAAVAPFTRRNCEVLTVSSLLWLHRSHCHGCRRKINVSPSCDEPWMCCSDSQFNQCGEMKQPSRSVLTSLGRLQ